MGIDMLDLYVTKLPLALKQPLPCLDINPYVNVSETSHENQTEIPDKQVHEEPLTPLKIEDPIPPNTETHETPITTPEIDYPIPSVPETYDPITHELDGKDPIPPEPEIVDPIPPECQTNEPIQPEPERVDPILPETQLQIEEHIVFNQNPQFNESQSKPNNQYQPQVEPEIYAF